MELKDIKKYRGYMPVRMEREDTLYFINDLIGNNWIEKLWFSKFSHYHTVRYRFGNIQEAQIYMKDKSWFSIPIQIWLMLSQQDKNAINQDGWQWINQQKSQFPKKISKVIDTSLDI